MLISASTRPRNLKRGVSDKKLSQLLGFTEAQGLRKQTGRIEFSAEDPHEFAFLTALYSAFSPIKEQKSTVRIEVDGKHVCSYHQEPK